MTKKYRITLQKPMKQVLLKREEQQTSLCQILEKKTTKTIFYLRMK